MGRGQEQLCFSSSILSYAVFWKFSKTTRPTRGMPRRAEFLVRVLLPWTREVKSRVAHEFLRLREKMAALPPNITRSRIPPATQANPKAIVKQSWPSPKQCELFPFHSLYFFVPFLPLRLRNRNARITSQSWSSAHMVCWAPAKLRFFSRVCSYVCSSSLFFVKISRKNSHHSAFKRGKSCLLRACCEGESFFLQI